MAKIYPLTKGVTQVNTQSLMAPPLRLQWRSEVGLTAAIPGDGCLYGITNDGKVAAFRAADGQVKWQSATVYAPKRLATSGSRLFAYRLGEGLGYVDDTATGPVEQLILSFNAAAGTNMSVPVTDGTMVYIAVNQGLYAWAEGEGLKFGAPLEADTPYKPVLAAARELVLLSGKGLPKRYHVGASGFELTWTGQDHGIDSPGAECPSLVTGNVLAIGVGAYTVAYDLATGAIKWSQPFSARSFAAANGVLYVSGPGLSIWAVRLTDGAVLWQRQYVYDAATQSDSTILHSGAHLFVGGPLLANTDRAVLLALDAANGNFSWISRAATGSWAAGFAVAGDSCLYAYSSTHVGAYATLSAAPSVPVSALRTSPRPLRGSRSSFGSGVIEVNLLAPARMSMAVYRAQPGLGSSLLAPTNWGAGHHQINWNPSSSGAFTDDNQFGFILFDVTEGNGVNYTQSHLVSVNTFPDIQFHWAKQSIETMVYQGHVNGYDDQTFKPDNLVTRAESSTIIAKTLGLQAPSAGFQTKFTDIAGHWAKNFITALEERGVIGGFAEPDGTFTFRPELNMTRAQEARILVRAYEITPAQPEFVSKFVDIVGHWAEADIKALEASGYVNGFREANGTYTYRPEQNLTRAELCTVVVRIQGL